MLFPRPDQSRETSFHLHDAGLGEVYGSSVHLQTRRCMLQYDTEKVETWEKRPKVARSYHLQTLKISADPDPFNVAYVSLG